MLHFLMLIEDRICKVECKLTQQVSIRYASRFWGLTKRKDGTRRRFKSLVFQTAAIDAMGCVQQPHFMGAIATSTTYDVRSTHLQGIIVCHQRSHGKNCAGSKCECLTIRTTASGRKEIKVNYEEKTYYETGKLTKK